jgi:hypothetical protein
MSGFPRPEERRCTVRHFARLATGPLGRSNSKTTHRDPQREHFRRLCHQHVDLCGLARRLR